MVFICDFCKVETMTILKVPCVVYDPEEDSLTMAKILNGDQSCMSICVTCLGLQNR